MPPGSLACIAAGRLHRGAGISPFVICWRKLLIGARARKLLIGGKTVHMHGSLETFGGLKLPA